VLAVSLKKNKNMNLQDLLEKGYFPKELPPCFMTELFGTKYNQVIADVQTNEIPAINQIVNQINSDRAIIAADKAEATIKAKEIFKNKLRYSDSVIFSIPKVGLSRNTIKIPNPLHQGKLADIITQNFADISNIYNSSTLSTTKPIIESETGEGKRAVKHENYGFFKEQCILNSFNYRFQLKTDISKYYTSIYTHTIPWVTFGGKDLYKKNRSLSVKDPARISIIYGDSIDDSVTWCQSQQTMGIPIGPDTSLIIAEIIACHLDYLLTKSLKKKKVEWIGYRYYDDYMMYFNSELDAQIGLNELRTILSEFELSINYEKTKISPTSNELEKDWALWIKSFLFRPNESDQKDDIWNFFSLAFKFAKDNPTESVLKFALNKFSFVRIEKENWDFFESLLFRLGLTEPASLQRLSKILISYKTLVNKKKLKSFCFELINRHSEKCHDYELTWALWLLKEFKIQPTKELFNDIFNSKSVCASIIALDLISRNNQIKNFDYTCITKLIQTENLNNKYWLLVYETVYKNWISSIQPTVITDHLYFKTLKDKDVFFYNPLKTLEPLKVEKNYFMKIDRKLSQIYKYLAVNKLNNEDVMNKISQLFQTLSLNNLQQQTTTNQIQNILNFSDNLLKEIISELEILKDGQQEFENKKVFFVVGKRLEELGQITTKEIESQARQNKDLLFDPKYD